MGGDESDQVTRAPQGVGVGFVRGVAEVDPEGGGEELLSQGQLAVPDRGPSVPQVQAQPWRVFRLFEGVDAHTCRLCRPSTTPSCRCFPGRFGRSGGGRQIRRSYAKAGKTSCLVITAVALRVGGVALRLVQANFKARDDS